MKNIFLSFLILSVCGLFLQACAIPPARINWQTTPGRIQHVNCSPQSPVCKTHWGTPIAY